MKKATRKPPSAASAGAYLREVRLVLDAPMDAPDDAPIDPAKYPFSIPALRDFPTIPLHPHVTFFIGENGSGKSTLIEAIAVAARFNPEGGSKNMSFATRESQSVLHRHLRLTRGHRREGGGYFLRAESFFNVATLVDQLGDNVIAAHGGTSLHEMSHGESFLALVRHRFWPDGIYIMDEPEAALSPQGQLGLLALIDDLVRQGSQFLIATHAPILMAYPRAWIYQLSDRGVNRIEYEDTEHFRLTRDFLNHRERYLKQLFSE